MAIVTVPSVVAPAESADVAEGIDAAEGVAAAETPASPGTPSRRSLLTAGLSGLAGLVLGAFGRPAPADAAAGSALIIGRTTNNAGTSATTLTTSSTSSGLRLSQNGSGQALQGVAASGGAYGVWGQNSGGTGAGGAIRASGGNNVGVLATTAAGSKSAVSASNTAAAKSTGAAITASGGKNDGLAATTTHGLAAAVRATNTGVYGGGMGGPVGVFALATQAQGYGVIGQAPNGIGVSGTSDSGAGIEGLSIDGPGVTGASDTAPGVSGTSNTGSAIYGMGGASYGVEAGSQSGVALYANSDMSYGVYCISANGSAALYADGDSVITGNLSVTGSVDKSGGTFRIDHPADPSRKYLQHSFVESPDMKNVYDGRARLDADGEASVELPAYFEALNRDCRVQLTPIGSFSPLFVRGPVANGRFAIAGGTPGQEVFWQVTGIRDDAWARAHPVTVELPKRGAERGRFLHPELYGAPASKSLAAAGRAKAQPRTAKG